ncbi:MAG: universal stress protein [Xanthomonadales bacterium]|nr:universal stress protein [Xanthomonadales bacterium]
MSDAAVAYPDALATMEERVAAIRGQGARELIWLLEHPPLYTAGTSARAADLVDPGTFPVYQMPQRIAVGSDGSTTANRAVEVASTLALAFDVPLLVVTAWRREADDPRSKEEAAGGSEWYGEAKWAQQVVADAAAVARRAGVPDVRTYTPVGSPGQALENLAAAQPDTLVVVGTVGLDSGAERLLGNIPHHLTHHLPGDLLLVRSAEDATHDWSTIMLTTDGSDTSVAAAHTGLALARALEATPVLVSAGSDEQALQRTLDEVANQIDDGAGPLELEAAVTEDVSGALVEACEGRGLVVLGNRRMHGMGRLLGSVPNDLTHEVPTDILLVNTSR